MNTKGNVSRGFMLVSRVFSVVALSLHEERHLLQRLQAAGSRVAAHPTVNRLKRKLIVRQLKRERGLPVFDLDLEVAHLLQARGLMPAQEHFKPQVTPPAAQCRGIFLSAACGDILLTAYFGPVAPPSRK